MKNDFSTAKDTWTKADPAFMAQLLKTAGWNVQPEEMTDCQLNWQFGLMYFVIDDTAHEVDLNDFTSRHKGLESGCFWSEWE